MVATYHYIFFKGTVDSNDSFNSNLLIEPGQDLSGSFPSSSAGAPVAGAAHHMPSGFPPNPSGYMVPPRKFTFIFLPAMIVYIVNFVRLPSAAWS